MIQAVRKNYTHGFHALATRVMARLLPVTTTIMTIFISQHLMQGHLIQDRPMQHRPMQHQPMGDQALLYR